MPILKPIIFDGIVDPREKARMYVMKIIEYIIKPHPEEFDFIMETIGNQSIMNSLYKQGTGQYMSLYNITKLTGDYAPILNARLLSQIHDYVYNELYITKLFLEQDKINTDEFMTCLRRFYKYKELTTSQYISLMCLAIA